MLGIVFLCMGTLTSCSLTISDQPGFDEDPIKLDVEVITFDSKGGEVALRTQSDNWRVDPSSVTFHQRRLVAERDFEVLYSGSGRIIGVRNNEFEVVKEGRLLHVYMAPKFTMEVREYSFVLQSGNYYHPLTIIQR